MELQRKDYPALLDALPPSQAVNVLNDRMRHVSQVNANIADWLQERRRVEELYVQGLRKLANKHPPDEASDLGVFSTPWQKIVSATEAAAESHHQLAQKIEADVERPLREFVSTNREVQAMATISGNLSAMAKEIEAAKKKSEKLRDKGAKAQANKVANAVADVESATLQWESQAPYVFEKLQAVDESRLNHLRDALTQFQTHEVDMVERNRNTAEETLNVLLNIQTEDEIKTFALRMQDGERPQSTRKQSATPTRTRAQTPTRNLAPPPPMPPTPQDDDRSQKSGSVDERKHSGGLQTLKRFGTVLGRRRESRHPYGRASSPERKSSSNLHNLGATLGSFGKGKSKDRDTASPSHARPGSPLRRLSTRASDASSSPQQKRQPDNERSNGTMSPEPANENGPSSSATNGIAQETIPELREPMSPPHASEPVPEPEKDAEGFSVPPSVVDAITQAEREAGLAANENNPTPQFKLDIRNAPIQEEDGDADAALASLANTLRAQAPAAPSRRTNTLRGRRDVRNTIFVPSPGTPELNTLSSIGETTAPPMPTSAPGTGTGTFPPSTLPIQPSAPIPPVQPSNSTLPMQPSSPPAFKLPHRTLLSDDHPSSDTQSVMSGRSLSSSSSTNLKHPDLHEPGLNSSIIETASAWFEQGKVTKAMVIGQIALAYNPIDISSGPFGTENIRLEKFEGLEKVAPNPGFIEQVKSQRNTEGEGEGNSNEATAVGHEGEYRVDLSRILKTSVAFHYQVHIDESNLTTFAPIILTPSWKSTPEHTSVIVHYTLNPEFAIGDAASVTLSNFVLVVRLEPGVRTTSCQSKPPGTFSREKGCIYWRVGDCVLTKDQPAQTMRARFFTEGEARPGSCEARWEIAGGAAVGLGSGLGVSVSAPMETRDGGKEKEKEKEVDPFADEDADAGKSEDKEREEGEKRMEMEMRWKEVATVKRIVSGTYLGV